MFNPGLCAMATLIGSYDELPSVHTKLHAWIKENHYKLNGAPFEVYQTDPHTTPKDTNIIEIFFPNKINTRRSIPICTVYTNQLYKKNHDFLAEII